MSTAVVTPTSAHVHFERRCKSASTTEPAGVPAIFAKAKADADGGLVLFRIGDYYMALGEDAEAVAEALGVELQIQPARAGRHFEKQILLREKQLHRNLRLLQAAGHQDIWIADQRGTREIDVEPIDIEAYDAIEVLSVSDHVKTYFSGPARRTLRQSGSV
jgi:hypothetical protein